MRKCMCFFGVGALSLALSAGAQTTRLDVQVSTDNINWNDSMFAPAGSTLYVRVIASTRMTTDESAAKICREIANAFEQQLTYPGEIKVTVVRESRFIEVAR